MRPSRRTSRTWSSRSRTSSALSRRARAQRPPYVALELICGEGQQAAARDGVVDQRPLRAESVSALDAAISAAYPDVRLGRVHAEQPAANRRAARARLPDPVSQGTQLVYSLIAAGEQLASSPLEQIARAQIAVGAPSIVRFQLTPTPSFFEELARRRTATRAQARAPRTLGAARRRPVVDVQPGGDARRRAHPEPQPVLARDRHRRRQPGGVQDGRRRRPIPPRGEPAAPPLDDRPPTPVPPTVPARARPAGPLVARPGVGRGGRAPARAPLRADEGRPRQPDHAPADPRPTRRRPRTRTPPPPRPTRSQPDDARARRSRPSRRTP